MNIRQTEKNITALYERLSRDDEGTGDSNSIINQKRLLEDYAAQKGFANCVHYTDDGYSGGTFDRPSWKRLLEDIDAGKVSTVLAKDMSRIGRDYLQTGFYTEVLFREKGVRFIAIGNGVDSADSSTSEFAPFLNIMNEWYLRDCSRKQKAAFQARSRAGKPYTSNVVYGYQKDANDKYHWIVDETAAAVVRRVYALCINGCGPEKIARILREDKVERPAVYMAKHNLGAWKTRVDMNRPYDWSSSSVIAILARMEYLGHTVNARTYVESYKSKRRIHRPQEEWQIIENTHEAIIDQGTWDLVQKLRQTPKRADKTGVANPLTGLLFCADCGAKMYNHKGSNQGKYDPATGLRTVDSYDCATFKISIHRVKTECCSHYINTLALRALILDTIKMVSTYAITNREAFIERVREASEVKQKESAKELERKIRKAEKRSKELNVLIRKLYESFALEKITENRFEMLLNDYEQEQTALEETISKSQTELNTFHADTDRAEQFLALSKKYTDFSELTTPMINEFIDKILVHAPQRIDGDRTQEVDIYLKFIGKFEVPVEPMPEPTPEELEARRQWLEKREHRRARDRAYYAKTKAKREAEKAAAITLEETSPV
jgi:DNA invertase Pin-like site-specific DNA recombinase